MIAEDISFVAQTYKNRYTYCESCIYMKQLRKSIGLPISRTLYWLKLCTATAKTDILRGKSVQLSCFLGILVDSYSLNVIEFGALRLRLSDFVDDLETTNRQAVSATAVVRRIDEAIVEEVQVVRAVTARRSRP